MTLPCHRDEPRHERRRPGGIVEGGCRQLQSAEVHPVASVDGPRRPDHLVERGLAAAGKRVVFEVVDHERTGVHELDRINDDRGSRATAASERVGLLEQGAPKPLAAHAGIEVGGELEGLGPAVPRAGGLMRRAGEAKEILGHVGSGPGVETNDLAKRIGARPRGGKPIMIRAASVNVKRWA